MPRGRAPANRSRRAQIQRFDSILATKMPRVSRKTMQAWKTLKPLPRARRAKSSTRPTGQQR